MGLRSLGVAYGCVSFASAAMHSIFITYYVHVYLDVFQVGSSSFYAVQAIFLAWNCLNDPLAALLLPPSYTLAIIRHGGCLWALALALVFLPMALLPTGVHLLLALCLYDSMLSCVMLVHASLLADVAHDQQTRTTLTSHASAFSLLGSCSVLGAQALWDVQAMPAFQLYVCLIATLACLAFQLSSTLLAPHLRGRHGRDGTGKGKGGKGKGTTGVGRDVRLWRRTLGQLFQLSNFWLWVCVNVVQVFNCHFNSNFMGVCMERLLGLEQGVGAKGLSSLLLLSTSLLPHLLVVLLSPITNAHGLHALLSYLFLLKALLALLLALLPASTLLVAVFLVANKSFSEAICRHGNLVVADICDEDRAVHHRQESVSSLVFAANALLTKAGQSLAPMLGWWLLDRLEYTPSSPSSPSLLQGLHTMLWAVPLVCAVLQLLVWSRFTLKGKYLEQMRRPPVPV